MLPFFLSSFSGMQRILGYGRPWRIVVVYPPKTGERRLRLEETLNWDSHHSALWHNWPSNASSVGRRPWIETQQLVSNDQLLLEMQMVLILSWWYFLASSKHLSSSTTTTCSHPQVLSSDKDIGWGVSHFLSQKIPEQPMCTPTTVGRVLLLLVCVYVYMCVCVCVWWAAFWLTRPLEIVTPV